MHSRGTEKISDLEQSESASVTTLLPQRSLLSQGLGGKIHRPERLATQQNASQTEIARWVYDWDRWEAVFQFDRDAANALAYDDRVSEPVAVRLLSHVDGEAQRYLQQRLGWSRQQAEAYIVYSNEHYLISGYVGRLSREDTKNLVNQLHDTDLLTDSLLVRAAAYQEYNIVVAGLCLRARQSLVLTEQTLNGGDHVRMSILVNAAQFNPTLRALFIELTIANWTAAKKRLWAQPTSRHRSSLEVLADFTGKILDITDLDFVVSSTLWSLTDPD